MSTASVLLRANNVSITIHGFTPLYATIYSICDYYFTSHSGHEEVVKLLLDSWADPNVSNFGVHWTPLHRAAYSGQEVAVKLLLEAGADVNKANSNGSTPLHLAISWGSKHMVELILDGQKDVVRLLLENGADPNNKESLCGCTPLYLASVKGYEDIVKILLVGGASIEKIKF